MRPDMDFSPLFDQIYSVLWWLVPVAIAAGILKSPWFKGVLGEFWVNLTIKPTLDKNLYRLIKNVTLPTVDGTTQIDHIIVSVFGVFVVETKNMRGWIFGSEYQATWTQKIYKHTTKFQNPLRQNYAHVKTLQSLLSLDDGQIFSVIAFVGDSTFKTDMPPNVTQGSGYVRHIKSKTEWVLTPVQVEEIFNTIKLGRLEPSWATHRAHVQHVRRKVEKKKNVVTCPKCGQSMVIRESKKGTNIGSRFWGCSRFPRCRGTRVMEESA